MPALEDRTIKCARYFQRSDGFIRFKDPDAMAARIAKLPDGGSMRLAAEDVEGYNIDTIRLLEAKAHESFNTTFNVEYYYYNMPRHLDDASDADAMSHVLARYGCLLESLQLKTERAAAVNFMTSNMPFGYTLVVPGPQPRSSGVAETGLNFLRPFTWQVWVAIIGLWLVTSAAIMFFENKEEYGEFGDRASRRRKGDAQSFAAPSKPKGHKSGLGSHTWANKFAYSSFSSWLTFTTGHFVTPVSAAGRLFTMVVTFVCLGLVAAYTANLATIFTTAALPVQGIGNINDLVARGARLCVKDSKTHTGFFKAVHPEVKLEAIKGEEPEVLDALMRGRCMAGASSNTHMSYFLATNASWCTLQFVGQPLNFGYYSIAFNKSDGLAPAVAALNVLLTDAIEKSELAPAQAEHFPPAEKRALCGGGEEDAAGDRAKLSLSIMQVAGLFMMAAVALLMSLVLHFTVDARRRGREWAERDLGRPHAGGRELLRSMTRISGATMPRRSLDAAAARAVGAHRSGARGGGAPNGAAAGAAGGRSEGVAAVLEGSVKDVDSV